MQSESVSRDDIQTLCRVHHGRWESPSSAASLTLPPSISIPKLQKESVSESVYHSQAARQPAPSPLPLLVHPSSELYPSIKLAITPLSVRPSLYPVAACLGRRRGVGTCPGWLLPPTSPPLSLSWLRSPQLDSLFLVLLPSAAGLPPNYCPLPERGGFLSTDGWKAGW